MKKTMNEPKPETNPDAQALQDAIGDVLSPETVAAVSYILGCTVTKDKVVNEQIRWLAEILANMVGGPSEQERMAEDIKVRIG